MKTILLTILFLNLFAMLILVLARKREDDKETGVQIGYDENKF